MDHPKVWQDQASGVVLGLSGSRRIGQLIQRELPAFDGQLWRWLVGPVADLVRQIKTDEDGLNPRTMLLAALGPEILTLSGFDLAVTAPEAFGAVRYVAIGAGRHWAYGSLRTSAALGAGTLDDWARLALEAAAQFSPVVGGPPFDVLEPTDRSGKSAQKATTSALGSRI